MESCNNFKLDVNIFGHLKVFGFIKLTSEFLSDVLIAGTFVDKTQNDDKRNDI